MTLYTMNPFYSIYRGMFYTGYETGDLSAVEADGERSTIISRLRVLSSQPQIVCVQIDTTELPRLYYMNNIVNPDNFSNYTCDMTTSMAADSHGFGDTPLHVLSG